MAGKSENRRINTSIETNKQELEKLGEVLPTNTTSMDANKQNKFIRLFSGLFSSSQSINSNSSGFRNRFTIVLSCLILLLINVGSKSKEHVKANISSVDMLNPIIEQVTTDKPIPLPTLASIKTKLERPAKKVTLAIPVNKVRKKKNPSNKPSTIKKPILTTYTQKVVATKAITNPINYTSGTTSTKIFKPIEKVEKKVIIESPAKITNSKSTMTPAPSVVIEKEKTQEVKQTTTRTFSTRVEPIEKEVSIKAPTTPIKNEYVDAVKEELKESESELIQGYRILKNQAKKEGKLLMLRFSADWCVPCRVMEETTLKDAKVQSLMKENYLSLKIDIQAFDGYNLKEQYNVKKIPAILVFNSEGKLIAKYDKSFSATEMLTMLEKHNTIANRQISQEIVVEDPRLQKEVLRITETINAMKQRVY